MSPSRLIHFKGLWYLRLMTHSWIYRRWLCVSNVASRTRSSVWIANAEREIKNKQHEVERPGGAWVWAPVHPHIFSFDICYVADGLFVQSTYKTNIYIFQHKNVYYGGRMALVQPPIRPTSHESNHNCHGRSDQRKVLFMGSFLQGCEIMTVCRWSFRIYGKKTNL